MFYLCYLPLDSLESQTEYNCELNRGIEIPKVFFYLQGDSWRLESAEKNTGWDWSKIEAPFEKQRGIGPEQDNLSGRMNLGKGTEAGKEKSLVTRKGSLWKRREEAAGRGGGRHTLSESETPSWDVSSHGGFR